MQSARYSISRQKACQQCSLAKVKCDRVETGCSRCVQRALRCTYPNSCVASKRTADADQRQSPTHTGGSSLRHDMRIANQRAEPTPLAVGSAHSCAEAEAGRDLPTPSGSGSISSDSPRSADIHVDMSPAATTRSQAGAPEIQAFEDLRLTCPIDADGISNRWVGAYIPLPDQSVKLYPPGTKIFIHRMIKAYVGVAVRGRGYPPFIHAAQLSGQLIRPPLSTCLSLIRICEHQLPGSEGAAADILQREMGNLYDQRGTYDAIALLCAFQAYLILTMVLFFRLEQIASPFLRQAMMNLQELACASAKSGLVCEAEQQGLRPRWESWIVAEANRRTLYTMYFLDGILSAHDGLPVFVGLELRGLTAPAGHALWRAQTRSDWEALYNTHLAEWSEGGLRIDELWAPPDDFDHADVIKRQDRVDHWLEGVDEFGTLLYAVTSSTHG
ncbi:hypothetical protein F4777DRAFT_240936 [Nemania sp. FL0916]|nr:hypothetical protein F4777DRAFT_240936 [Nemania sp. FL0916]